MMAMCALLEARAANGLSKMRSAHPIPFYTIVACLVTGIVLLVISSTTTLDNQLYSSSGNSVKENKNAIHDTKSHKESTPNQTLNNLEGINNVLAQAGPISISVLQTVIRHLSQPVSQTTNGLPSPDDKRSAMIPSSSLSWMSSLLDSFRSPPAPAVRGIPHPKRPQQDDVAGFPPGISFGNLPVDFDYQDLRTSSVWPKLDKDSKSSIEGDSFWNMSNRYEAFFYRWFGRQRRRCLMSTDKTSQIAWSDNQRRAQAEIYAHQFPSRETCKTKKFLIVEPYRAGVGAMLQVLSAQLAVAISTDRILLLHDRRWPYSAGCPEYFSHDNVNARRSKRVLPSYHIADFSQAELDEGDAYLSTLKNEGVTPEKLARSSRFDTVGDSEEAANDSSDFKSGGLGCFIEPISSCTLEDAGLTPSDIESLGCVDKLIPYDSLMPDDLRNGWVAPQKQKLDNSIKFAKSPRVRTACQTKQLSSEKELRCIDRLDTSEQVLFCTREDDPRHSTKSSSTDSLTVPLQWAVAAGLDTNWWRAQSVRFFLRPSPRLVRELELRLQTSVRLQSSQPTQPPPSNIRPQLPGPVVSVHVRHGDKIREATPLDWKSYEQVLMTLAMSSRWTYQPNSLFISTDDPSIFSEIADSQQRAAAASLSTLPNPAALLGSMEIAYLHHQRDNSAASDLRDGSRMGVSFMGTEESMIAFLNLFASARSQYFVGTLTSNWCHLVNQLRLTRGDCTAPYVDVERQYKLQF